MPSIALSRPRSIGSSATDAPPDSVVKTRSGARERARLGGPFHVADRGTTPGACRRHPRMATLAAHAVGSLHHVRRHGRRRHHGSQRQGARDARGDRRLRDRGRACGRGDRPHPRARSGDGPRVARDRAVPASRRACPCGRRRCRAEPDRRHGRRPRARRRACSPAGRCVRDGHGRSTRASRAHRGAQARDLHARLRHDELRSRR